MLIFFIKCVLCCDEVPSQLLSAPSMEVSDAIWNQALLVFEAFTPIEVASSIVLLIFRGFQLPYC